MTIHNGMQLDLNGRKQLPEMVSSDPSCGGANRVYGFENRIRVTPMTPVACARERLETLFPSLSAQERTLLFDLDNARDHLLRAMELRHQEMSKEFIAATDFCINILEESFLVLRDHVRSEAFLAKLTASEQEIIQKEYLEIEFACNDA